MFSIPQKGQIFGPFEILGQVHWCGSCVQILEFAFQWSTSDIFDAGESPSLHPRENNITDGRFVFAGISILQDCYSADLVYTFEE